MVRKRIAKQKNHIKVQRQAQSCVIISHSNILIKKKTVYHKFKGISVLLVITTTKASRNDIQTFMWIQSMEFPGLHKRLSLRTELHVVPLKTLAVVYMSPSNNEVVMGGAWLDVPETQQRLVLGGPGKGRQTSQTRIRKWAGRFIEFKSPVRKSTLTLRRISVSVWSFSIWQKAHSSSPVSILGCLLVPFPWGHFNKLDGWAHPVCTLAQGRDCCLGDDVRTTSR